MRFQLVILLVVLSYCDYVPPEKIYLAGFYPLTSFERIAAQQRLSATMMAIEKINKEKTLLPQTELVLLVKDTRQSSFVSLKLATDLMEEFRGRNVSQRQIIAIIGSSASYETQIIQAISASYNVTQISYASTSVELSDEIYLARTVASDHLQAMAATSLISYFGWKHVSIVNTRELYGISGANEFIKECDKLKIEVVVHTTFEAGTTDVSVPLNKLKNAKIIYVMMSSSNARVLLRKALKLGMIGPNSDKIWILSEGAAQPQIYQEIVNSDIVVIPDVITALKGCLGTSPLGGNGPLYKEFEDRWITSNSSIYPSTGPDTTINLFAPYAYDTAMVYAHVFSNLIKSSNLSVDTPAGVIFNEIVMANFTGLTGPISFLPEGDRIESFRFLNFVSNDTYTGFIQFAAWDPTSLSISMERLPIFPDGTTNIPIDDRILVYVSYGTLGDIFLSLSILGIVLIIVLSVLLIKWRRYNVLYASTSTFIVSILSATFLGYLTIIILSLNPTSTICLLVIWTGHSAFSILAGSFLSNNLLEYFDRFRVTEKKVFMLIACYVISVWVYLFIVTTLNPPVCVNTLFGDRYFTYTCSGLSNTMFTVLYLFEFFSLVFSAILSSCINKAHFTKMNEQASIIIVTSVLTISTAALVPLSYVLDILPLNLYAFQSASIFILSTFTLCILLVPNLIRSYCYMAMNFVVSEGVSIDTPPFNSSNTHNTHEEESILVDEDTIKSDCAGSSD